MADSITAGSSASAIQSSYEKYKDYFATDESTALDQSDFLSLMVEQLKNQDFNNPTDNTEFIAQMAQFSALQSQQQMTYYSQASYAASLVGKNVVVGYTDASGKYVTDEGAISSMKFSGNDFLFIVNGYSYSSKNIMEVKAEASVDSVVRLTKNVDLSKVSTLPALSGTPTVAVNFTGTQSVPLKLKLVDGSADSVTAYTADKESAVLTITLQEMGNIKTTSDLVTRINSAINSAVISPADPEKPILTSENFTAGKINIKVSSSGVFHADGSSLTEEDISGINEAAAKTLIGLGTLELY